MCPGASRTTSRHLPGRMYTKSPLRGVDNHQCRAGLSIKQSPCIIDIYVRRIPVRRSLCPSSCLCVRLPGPSPVRVATVKRKTQTRECPPSVVICGNIYHTWPIKQSYTINLPARGVFTLPMCTDLIRFEIQKKKKPSKTTFLNEFALRYTRKCIVRNKTRAGFSLLL